MLRTQDDLRKDINNNLRMPSYSYILFDILRYYQIFLDIPKCSYIFLDDKSLRINENSAKINGINYVVFLRRRRRADRPGAKCTISSICLDIIRYSHRFFCNCWNLIHTLDIVFAIVKISLTRLSLLLQLSDHILRCSHIFIYVLAVCDPLNLASTTLYS